MQISTAQSIGHKSQKVLTSKISTCESTDLPVFRGRCYDPSRRLGTLMFCRATSRTSVSSGDAMVSLDSLLRSLALASRSNFLLRCPLGRLAALAVFA